MDVKSFAIRLLLTVPALGTIPGGRAPAADAPTHKALFAVGQASGLAEQYGLGVVAVPEAPTFMAVAVPEKPSCPVEVRGFVSGGEPEETFVVVAVGDESSLLKQGQGIRTRDGFVAVSAIHADHVVVRRGDAAFDCYFGAARSGAESR